MPRKPKKPPWNADKVLFPSLEDPTYKHEIKPLPGKVHVGHSTPTSMPVLETWHVVEVLSDGTEKVVMAGDHPWAGSSTSAGVEASRLTRVTGRPHKAVPAGEQR